MSQALRTASNGAPGTLSLFHPLSLSLLTSLCSLQRLSAHRHLAPISLWESTVRCVNYKTDKADETQKSTIKGFFTPRLKSKIRDAFSFLVSCLHAVSHFKGTVHAHL